MTKDQFISIINRLKKQKEHDNAFSKHMEQAFPGCHSPIYDDSQLWLAVIETLEIVFDDKDKYIDWWIYETQFGTKDLCVSDEGKETYLRDPGDLYDYLLSKYQKYN